MDAQFTDGESMVRIIVETTFGQPISQAEWDAAVEEQTPCLHQRNITWIRTYMSRDRQRTICELEASDAETVRETYRINNIPFDSVWNAQVLEP